MTAGPVMVGRYRLGAVLGVGPDTVTHRAEDTRLGRDVALKVLSPGAGPDGEPRERLVAEARLAARVAHPHVVPLLDAGESHGVVHLAFQLAPDGDLRMLLERERRLDPARVARLLGPIAAALDALHAQGIIHADVKPGNVVLTALGEPDERAALVDFGNALTISEPSDRCTARGATPDYAPPEQLRGDRIDARADVHALAAVVWECLAGAPPSAAGSDAFGFWPPDPHGSLARFDEVRPDLHAEVGDALASALATTPEERPASAGAFFAELAPALRRGTRPTLPVAPGRASSEVPRGARLRRRAGFALAGAVAAGALAVTTGFALPSHSSGALPRPTPATRGGSSREERALRAAIPRRIRPSCHAATAPRPASAVLTCTDGPVRVQYGRYPTVTAMRIAFGTETLTARTEHADLCAQGLADEWTWRTDSTAVTPAGSYRCTVQPDGARLEWSTESTRTVSRAIRVDGDLRELHAWWAGAGPDAAPEPTTTAAGPG
jgi:hypothetical protein